MSEGRTGSTRPEESHVLTLDGFTFDVSVEADGSVGLYFQEFGREPLLVTPADLGRCVAFAELHGQITVVARDA